MFGEVPKVTLGEKFAAVNVLIKWEKDKANDINFFVDHSEDKIENEPQIRRKKETWKKKTENWQLMQCTQMRRISIKILVFLNWFVSLI